jgi:hypothetical protein
MERNVQETLDVTSKHLGCVPTSTSHEKLEARAMVLKNRRVTIPEISQKLSAKGKNI